jgi:hypothetical protein
MNWLKRKFGKRNWETVYQRKCLAQHMVLSVPCGEITVVARFDVDRERNNHRCYITDGERKTCYDASYFAVLFEDFIPYFKQENIKY